MPQTLPRLNHVHRLSLRQRILLIFAGMAAASMLALALGLYYGYLKNPSPWSLDAVIVGGVIAAFCILGMIFGVWRLFDEHVAKPIERLTGELRTRVHSHVDSHLEDLNARHLGDLAAAASSLMRHLNEARNELAEVVARETTRHVAEKERLIGVLADVPIGILVCTAGHRLIFYNAEAATLLGTEPGLCLNRSVFACLDAAPIETAYSKLVKGIEANSIEPIALSCAPYDQSRILHAHMRLLDGDSEYNGYILVLAPSAAHGQNQHRETVSGPSGTVGAPANSGVCAVDVRPARAVVYDFELLERTGHADIANTLLHALTYVVFDTETTGLLPDSGDEIVQLAAVRIVNGRRVEAERFDTLVNPGRTIPAASTLIHGITDEMVATAPPIEEAARRFHDFADAAVLVAHNAGFDMSFLRRLDRRIGLKFDQPVLDTVLLSALVFGDGENHSLDALAARLAISLPAEIRHTAIGDASATAEALLKLLRALQARGLHTFGDLEEELQRHRRVLKGVGF